jgi:hypothetical protein
MFSRIPLYKEIAAWILPFRNKQKGLCNILREIGFEGNLGNEHIPIHIDGNGRLSMFHISRNNI